MNRTRNILIMIAVAVVFFASFMIIQAVTEPPQKSLDFAFATHEGKVTGLYDVARGGGAVLIFFDPEVEGSNDVLSRVIDGVGDKPVVAVSVSGLSKDEQLALLPQNAKELDYLCFEGNSAADLYNIGNAPVTYFIDSEFYVINAFVGNIKDKTIASCVQKMVAE